MSGQASSGGYWLLSAADEIVVSPTAILGSIGAAVSIERGEDDGLVVFTSEQSPLKNADPTTKEGKAANQVVANDLGQVFVESVAAYRGLSEETVLSDFGRGGVKVGAKAVEAGMADRVASVKTVIAGFAGNEETMTDQKTPVITREFVASEHPAVYAEIKDAAHAEGLKVGAKAESDRIQAVLGNSMPGHEDLIQSLAFDGVTTGPEAAVKVLQAEKGARATQLEDHKKDAKLSVVTTVETDEGSDAGLSIKEQCEARWKKDPKIREEFSSLAIYTACMEGSKTHNVRVLGGNK